MKLDGAIMLISGKVCYFLLITLMVSLLLKSPSQVAASVRVEALTVYETSDGVSIVNGMIVASPFLKFTVGIWGSNFSSTDNLDKNIFVSFTEKMANRSQSCDNLRSTDVHEVTADVDRNGRIASMDIKFEQNRGGQFYICIKEEVMDRLGNSTTSRWVHQGTDRHVTIKVLKKGFTIPYAIQVIIVIILMVLSGLFSGLNLGLMSLDPNELKIVQNSGSIRHKKYAKKILPVRRHGNFLLCTLLLGNTLVNASFTILLDKLVGSGAVAVIGSTLAIVIMGEIIPQSICSRYGLAVGAYTIWLTKLFMVLTFPLSFPVSRVLDCILGKELGTIYNKHQLLEMLKVQNEFNDLEQDEVGIISGALKYRSKTVEEVMTAIEDCYMLDEDAVLDFETMTSIVKSGYSRIPIYSGDRSNIVALLFVKDLTFTDPDDCIPLLSLIKFYKHQVHKTFFDTTLDKMLEEFKQGTTHLSVVLKVNDQGEKDPTYECIGIVTLEDIIEEIIQDEIVDETDVYVDNVSGKKVARRKANAHDFSMFLPTSAEQAKKITPHLSFAIFQYLGTAISAFSEELVSRTVLKKLIDYPGVVQEKVIDETMKEKDSYLYRKTQIADFFILILQGRVEVTIGKECIIFEDGPFSAFGLGALIGDANFLPDYDIKILATVTYLKVNKAIYRSAVRATQLEREQKTTEFTEIDEFFLGHCHSNSNLLQTTPDAEANEDMDDNLKSGKQIGKSVIDKRIISNNLKKRSGSQQNLIPSDVDFENTNDLSSTEVHQLGVENKTSAL